MATTKKWTGFSYGHRMIPYKKSTIEIKWNTSKPKTPSIFPRSCDEEKTWTAFELEHQGKKSFGVVCRCCVKSKLKFVWKVASLHHHRYTFLLSSLLSYFFLLKFCFRIDFSTAVFSMLLALFFAEKRMYFLYHKFILIPFCIF